MNFDKIKEKVAKTKAGSTGYTNKGDDGFWQLEGDKAGNGRAVIRFLPGRTDNDDPYVETHRHGFKNKVGKWYIENCPKTIGKECPACEANYALTGGYPNWEAVPKDIKDLYSVRKKKTHYIFNILVVEDPTNPDNEGKVFLFKANKSIFTKIADKILPSFDDEKPCNVFNPVDGANFKIKMRQVDGWANFDKSEFEEPSEIGNQKQIDAVMNKVADLSKFIAPSEFKSYEELEEKLNKIINMESAAPQRSSLDNGSDAPRKRREIVEDDDDIDPTKDIPEKKESVSRKPIDDDDDDIDFFKKMAAED